MANNGLTKEQEAFLSECLIEFSDRYTDADPSYKAVFDAGIPKPPIVYPWYARPKLNNLNRDRGSGRRDLHSGYRDRDSSEHRHKRSREEYRDDRYKNNDHYEGSDRKRQRYY